MTEPSEEALREFLLAGTSSSSGRTLDGRALAALRPQAPPRKRTRAQQGTPAPPPVPAASETVFAGMVCFCGQRFGPNQAAEFMLHVREEVAADVELAAKVRKWRREAASKRPRNSRPPALAPEQRRERRNAAQQARREAAGMPCACGCGEMTRSGRQFRPGHHQRVPDRQAGRRRDPAKIAEAFRLYHQEGLSERATAARLGVHQATVHRWLAGQTRPPGPPRPDPARDARILELRERDGLSWSALASEVGMSRTGARMRYYALTGRPRPGRA